MGPRNTKEGKGKCTVLTVFGERHVLEIKLAAVMPDWRH